MEAESEKGVGGRPVRPVQFNVHQIQLDVGEQRVLQSFSPHDQVRVGEMILAKAELFGQTYTCRLMERVPAWRICDKHGRYIHVDFPQLVKELKPSQIRYELINAPPHCWIETEVKRKHAKKMENVSKDKAPRPVRTRNSVRAD